MRHNPIISETDASRLTVTIAALVIVACAVGALVSPLVGLIVFAVPALAGFALYMGRPEGGRRRPLRRAAQERHPHAPAAGVHRLLIVANEALGGEELSEHIRRPRAEPVEVDVLAPVLTSRAHLAYTDVDSDRRRARERLLQSLAWANARGIAVRGKIGDASPATALEDELRDFGADEVIVATGAVQPSRWQERLELDRLRDELDVPVRQVTVG